MPNEGQKEGPLLKRLSSKVKQASIRYGLFSKGDKLAIALSGGKDSLALVALLGTLRGPLQLDLVAIHIAFPGIGYRVDEDALRQHCTRFGVRLIVHRDEEVRITPEHERSPCYHCSHQRRNVLFRIVREERCAAVAFGHHQDDVLETLLMNMTLHGSVAAMAPRLRMEKDGVTVIRPMCLIRERELAALAAVGGYRADDVHCPFERVSARVEFKRVLSRLEEIAPQAAKNIWASMENVKQEYLPLSASTGGKRKSKTLAEVAKKVKQESENVDIEEIIV